MSRLAPLTSLGLRLMDAVIERDDATLTLVLALPEVQALAQQARTFLDDEDNLRRVLVCLGGARRCGVWADTPVADLLAPWSKSSPYWPAACQMVGSRDTWDDLEEAIQKKKAPLFVATLLSYVIDPRTLQAQDETDRAVIHAAIQMQNGPMFEHLLKHTDVTRQGLNNEGNTLLMWAAAHGTPAMAERLVGLNRWTGVDTNHDGLNVLHHAVSRGTRSGTSQDRAEVIEHLWPLLTPDQVWQRALSKPLTSDGLKTHILGKIPLETLLDTWLSGETSIIDKILACPFPSTAPEDAVQDLLWPAVSRATNNRAWNIALKMLRTMPVARAKAWLRREEEEQPLWLSATPDVGKEGFLNQLTLHVETVTLTELAKKVGSVTNPVPTSLRPRL